MTAQSFKQRCRYCKLNTFFSLKDEEALYNTSQEYLAGYIVGPESKITKLRLGKLNPCRKKVKIKFY